MTITQSLASDPCAPLVREIPAAPTDGATPIVDVPAGKRKQVIAPDPFRRSLDIVNTGSVLVWIGFDNSVNGSSSGFPLPAGQTPPNGAAWSGNVAAGVWVYTPPGGADGQVAVLSTTGPQ